jgi:hypothetical protein
MIDKINIKIAELDADIQYHKEEIKKAEEKKALWEELKADEVADAEEVAEGEEEPGDLGSEDEDEEVEDESPNIRVISYPID